MGIVMLQLIRKFLPYINKKNGILCRPEDTWINGGMRKDFLWKSSEWEL